MGDKHGLAPGQLQDKPLVPGAVIIVRDQPDNEAGVLDPAIVVRLFVALFYAPVILP